MKLSRFAMAALLCGTAIISSADVLMLKDGQAITGRLQGADQGSVTFVVNGQSRRYQLYEVNSITFSLEPTPAAAAPPPPAPAPAPPAMDSRPTLARRPDPAYGTGSSSPTPSRSADMDRPSTASSTPTPSRAADMDRRTATPLNVTVPAGTIITVRMIDPVDSATDVVGQTYKASLDEPIIVGGQTIASRGADVTAKLVSKEEAGKLSGRSELNLVLLDITVQGRKYEVTTGEVSQAGSSRGKQTATRVGIGTVLGATIGAIAGGGKGAAIGAATGAGAGGAVQVMTNGEQVKIPSETRLEFTTEQPLRL